MRESKAPRPPRKRAKATKTLDRVLIVEDDLVLALALEGALLDAGVREVVICPSLASTVEELEKGEADAVVLDVHLADGDEGWAVAELIGQLGPRQPRIIFSTGSPEAIPASIAELGTVFAKPYDPARLANELTTVPSKDGLLARLRDAIS